MKMEWFKHDIDASTDDKLVLLVSEHGAAAYGLYWRIVEALYKADGELSEKALRAVVKSLHLTAKKADLMIKEMIDLKLFDKNCDKVLSKRVKVEISSFSEEGQRRAEHSKLMNQIRWEKKMAQLLVSQENKTNNEPSAEESAQDPARIPERIPEGTAEGNPAGNPKQNKIKENKTKENKKEDIKKEIIKEKTATFDSLIQEQEPELQANWRSFVEMRKSIKAPLTLNAFKLSVSQLHKLGSTTIEMNEILAQSIRCGYRGLFPIKAATAGASTAHDEWAGIAAGEIRL